jgi:type I site-specific restriction-modification system R (restriction) subunit
MSIKTLLLNILLPVFFGLISCQTTIHKPSNLVDVTVIKDILDKPTITESDKKIISKILDSKVSEDKETKKYIEKLEDRKEKSETKIVNLSQKSGQVDLINKVFFICALAGIGILLWKFAPALMELIKKIPL